MKRLVAALLAAMLLPGSVPMAACAAAQAVAPFEEVPLSPPARATHRLAYASVAAGAVLVGSSFAWANLANHTYEDYLNETSPSRIESLYDRTARYDRISSLSLIAGEVLVATGLYLRFVHHPGASRVRLSFGPQRCAASVRF